MCLYSLLAAGMEYFCALEVAGERVRRPCVSFILLLLVVLSLENQIMQFFVIRNSDFSTKRNDGSTILDEISLYALCSPLAPFAAPPNF